MKILTLDFETKTITPDTPWPEPVGVAWKWNGDPARYDAWGHPCGNNTTVLLARNRLFDAVGHADRVVMFNAPFDRGVAHAHLGISIPWAKVEDMQIGAFLHEPYADRLDLKSVAHRVLGIAPDEQTDLYAWIKEHVPAAKGKRKLGAFIAWADGRIVGRYARGDVLRTWGLYRFFQALVKSRGYQREVRLLPVLDDMTRIGVPLDEDGLQRDYPTWVAALKQAEAYLRRMLKTDIDLDSHEHVANACEKAGLVSEWIETAKGRRSLGFDSLSVLVAEGKFDARFAHAWGYRSVLQHSLSTFAEPWLAAGKSIHPQWNGTRQERGGARTGRLSSTPNVQNIVKVPPTFAVPRSWPALPRMRHYVKAPRGQRIAGADISQQELKILADAVGEPLLSWYREDPKLDLHQKVSELIHQVTGIRLERKDTKTINFAKIYGAGVARLAAQLGRSEEEAGLFKTAHTQALPGVRRWENKLRGQATFETAGGREYCHDPERPYKSPNTYIQGSAADQAKEVMLEVQPELVKLGHSLAWMAHDEFVSLGPVGTAKRARDAMLDVIASTGWRGSREMFTVPMVGEGYVRTRWQE